VAIPTPKASTDLRDLIAGLQVEFGRLDERMRSQSETLGESMTLIKELNKRLEELANEIRASREENKDSTRLLEEKVNRESARIDGVEARVKRIEEAQAEHARLHASEQEAYREATEKQKAIAQERAHERKKFLWEKEISLKHALILAVGTVFVTGLLDLLMAWLRSLIH